MGFTVHFGVVSVYLGSLLAISFVINQVQPISYLDEIYHVPQAQEYCKGNFTHWDHRITTLPGLYLLSVGIITPVSKWVGQNFCDLFHLRLTNVVLSVINLLLVFWLTSKIHQSKESNRWKLLLSSVNIGLFPPLFFFSFLYYTDVAAVCLVLLMYCLHLDGKNNLAAIAAIMAVLMRQTNIIWAVLVAVKCMDESLQKLLLTSQDCKKDRSIWNRIKIIAKRMWDLKLFRKYQLVRDLFSILLPYMIVGVLFIAFVVLNNGLVVGDREAHQASINVPQLFYFFALITVFSAPHWIVHIRPFLTLCVKKWHLVLIAVAGVALVIRCNTLVHPYLLADNRHYTFYIWKRVFEYHPMGRYLIIPFYLFGAFVTYRTMVKTSSLFACAFIICSFLVLVPQRLLEIRYFFIPYLFVRLHVAPRTWMSLSLELAMFVALNVATIYLFLNRPFYWSDSPLVQRFMW